MKRIKELEAHLQKWEYRSNANELEIVKQNLLKIEKKLEECRENLDDGKISEAEVCQEKLENKIERNIYLQNEKSQLLLTLGESRSNASSIQKLAEDCQANLIEKNDQYENLETSYLKIQTDFLQLNETLGKQKNQKSHKNCEELEEYICSINFPVWSEWSDCSSDRCGTKTRMNVCKNGDKQIRRCYEDKTCPDSGEFSLNNWGYPLNN